MVLQSIDTRLGTKSDLLIVLGTIGIISVLFIPLPPMALDFLSICNIGIALLILLLTFYSDKPLSFSTFPSILLITTLFRLALNISATRLILDDAKAGKVIAVIGQHVVGGNYVVGVVVFIILIVVQYVVVTSGAQRVAEVAARFTLDSMPGKQMSIDADLNIGVIDELEAKRKREEIQQEANFYGAMDGATKFVKGDAIAGIIIIFVDIIAGLMMGVGHHGMSWSHALHTYTLLTVGDGIVTQIPSLIIATATGIIITRAATDAKLGFEVVEQITAHPITLLILATCLLILMFVPGMPIGALVMAFLIVIVMLVYSYRSSTFREEQASEIVETEGKDLCQSNEKEELYRQLELHPIEIRLGVGLQDVIEDVKHSLYERVQNFRKQYALDSGFVIPAVKVIGNHTDVDADSYAIYIYGVKLGEGQIRLGHRLAIAGTQTKVQLEGEQTTEPTYGLPAVWVSENMVDMARSANYTLVDWQTMLITHLGEVIRTHSKDLLTRSEVEKLLERNKLGCEGLVQEIVPKIMSLTDIQRVLQLLIKESVPIRNIELILEVLADAGKRQKAHEELAEEVRLRLGAAICQSLVGSHGKLEVLTLDPNLERLLITTVNPPERVSAFSIDPSGKEKLISAIAQSAQRMMSRNHMPVIMCSPVIRRRLKQLTERALPRIAILSMTEIPVTIHVNSFDVVRASVQSANIEAQHG
ncbi:flagellar biosynthesis protein FlhA [Vibrio cincinnatiensis]|uniref:flagellar biosynthesis protein FlhA n=1 Tax=Vibrio cincinnatiensis TaxID=675 RepID=UPI001EE02E1B|nr:flagellar biosynthesis protein FlhA [Vibrio cincinnatiensis]MCG3723687.1 flagellar type III secretion system protein FlhA [Vibrio cincinnatiensis]